MAKLNKTEKALLKSYEAGEWKSAKPTNDDILKYRRYARSTFQKDRRVNIRISSKDLEDMRKKALQEGIPYQTLIASVIHKYVSGVLKERAA